MLGLDISDDTLRIQEMEADDQISRLGKCIACLNPRPLDQDQLCRSCGNTDARKELLALLKTK
jgi:hypothetical protein